MFTASIVALFLIGAGLSVVCDHKLKAFDKEIIKKAEATRPAIFLKAVLLLTFIVFLMFDLSSNVLPYAVASLTSQGKMSPLAFGIIHTVQGWAKWRIGHVIAVVIGFSILSLLTLRTAKRFSNS